MRVIFLKIGEIDTVKENFAADVFVQAKWAEAALNTHTVRAHGKLEIVEVK